MRNKSAASRGLVVGVAIDWIGWRQESVSGLVVMVIDWLAKVLVVVRAERAKSEQGHAGQGLRTNRRAGFNIGSNWPIVRGVSVAGRRH